MAWRKCNNLKKAKLQKTEAGLSQFSHLPRRTVQVVQLYRHLEASMDIAELIQQFQNDMWSDAHIVSSRFNRSQAKREMIKRGQEVLAPIIAYLEEHRPEHERPSPQGAGCWAWCMLLWEIQKKIDNGNEEPQMLNEIEPWLTWAKPFAIAA